MPRDFTQKVYKDLIRTIQNTGYNFTSYEKFVESGQIGRNYILRHDVDKLPQRSVDVAKIESESGALGTFYFRIVPQSFDIKAIKEIAAMGHEIGYHYEDLALCNGNFKKAYEQFLVNLDKFREYYPVRTICMHGSPLSKWDNRRLWEEFDYKKSGIIAEPYFDTDFNKVFYITDTSRSWNAEKYSIRDKVQSRFDIKIDSTLDLIRKLNNNVLPSRIMQNIHPQRWTDSIVGWTKEYITQNIKNVVKGFISVPNS